MENIDGKLTDSNIIRLARSKSATVSIYPNSVHDNLVIDMSQARPAVIHVIDLNRRIYKVIAVNASSTLIDVNDLGKVYTS